VHFSEPQPTLQAGRPGKEAEARLYGEPLRVGAVCTVYYLAVALALKLEVGFSPISILWPANALLTAALLLTPPRRWWVYLAAVIPVHIMAQGPGAVAPGWFAVQIVYNSALAVVAALAIRHFAFAAYWFDRVRETIAFLIVGTLAPGMVAAAIVGIVIVSVPHEALIRHGWTSGWWNATRQVALCNAVSLLGVVPGILVWAGGTQNPIRPLRRERLGELVFAVVLLISTNWMMFTRRETPLYLQSALFLVPMLFLLWAAVRFGARGAATALLAIVCISGWGASRSAGPFTGGSSTDRAVSVQLFWILLAWPGMALAAAIEERKRAEATLKSGQQRYELATAAGHVAVWSYNYRTEEVIADRALSAMLGYDPDHARSGGDWVQRIHSEDLESILARDDEIKSPDAPRNASGETPIPTIQYRLRCADGSYRWFSNSGTLYWDGDAPALAVGTNTDITDSKKAEEASLARQKLESLGVLAGGIAHDFNNLLGSIHIQAELAEMTIADGLSPREEIQTIKTISIRASEIVRQLMIYAGHEKSNFEPLDLSLLVAEMLALLRVSISKGAVLETELEEGLPAVFGNAPQIRQVVMNLVLNASDALGEQGGTIRISTTAAANRSRGVLVPPNGLRGGQQVRLVISDTGSGIAKEALAKIFDPFFTTKLAGRGLGLAVVQGIVRAHGGAIYLDSVPGQGTTFQILWPVAERASEAPVEAGSDAVYGKPPGTRGSVLIVEDETVLRFSVARILRKEGFAVIEAGDGSAALELLRDRHREVDIILLDATIPGAASEAVIAEGARIRPDIKVLLTSAYSREMAGPGADASQVRGFIRKPFRLQELVTLLQETLTSGRRSTSSGMSD
jgi:nitrogen-specific signal transduction histidine kinase/PAS domain-containing protein/ActR/RegA family two-component response regulator